MAIDVESSCTDSAHPITEDNEEFYPEVDPEASSENRDQDSSIHSELSSNEEEYDWDYDRDDDLDTEQFLAEDSSYIGTEEVSADDGEFSNRSGDRENEEPTSISAKDDLQNNAFYVFGSLSNRKFFNALTISDDHSSGSKIELRNLSVLRDRKEDLAPKQEKSAPKQEEVARTLAELARKQEEYARKQFPFSGNNAHQDHQMQLMLLEQQNTKRLLMARQEQEGLELIGSSETETSTSAGKNPVYALQPGGLRDAGMELDPTHILGGLDTTQLDLKKLQEYIQLLQVKAHQFEATEKEHVPNRHQVLYRIVDFVSLKNSGKTRRVSGPYFDRPEWINEQVHKVGLRCSSPVTNFELFLEKNKDLSFLVYEYFDSDHEATRPKSSREGWLDIDVLSSSSSSSSPPQRTSQSVRPVSEDLCKAIEAILGCRAEYTQTLDVYRDSQELKAPYLFLYHSREDFDQFQKDLSPKAYAQLRLFFDFVMENYGQTYARVDSLLSRGKITTKYVNYLIKPGDVLFSCQNGNHQGYIATSWPSFLSVKEISRSGVNFDNSGNRTFYNPQEASTKFQGKKTRVYVWRIEVWHWAFDGNFQRKYTSLELKFPINDEDSDDTPVERDKLNAQTTNGDAFESSEKSISELNVFPRRFAPDAIVNTLRRRGRTFWACRVRRLVSYQGDETEMAENSVSWSLRRQNCVTIL